MSKRTFFSRSDDRVGFLVCYPHTDLCRTNTWLRYCEETPTCPHALTAMSVPLWSAMMPADKLC